MPESVVRALTIRAARSSLAEELPSVPGYAVLKRRRCSGIRHLHSVACPGLTGRSGSISSDGFTDGTHPL